MFEKFAKLETGEKIGLIIAAFLMVGAVVAAVAGILSGMPI